MRTLRLTLLALVAAAIVVSNGAAIDIETAVLPDAIVGEPYTFQFEGEGGCPNSYRFNFSSGRLPAGLAVTTDGKLVGTPMEAGEFKFYVNIGDNCGTLTSQEQYTLIVLPRLVVDTSKLATATVNVPYTATLTALGGGTQTWSVGGGALPPGLALSSSGVLSGTPSATGAFTFTAKVADAKRAGTKELTLNVITPLSLPAPTLPRSEVGAAFSAILAANGGLAPLRWSVAAGALPAGLVLDAARGTISGKPRASGTFRFTLAVADADGTTATVDTSVSIVRKLEIATKRLPAANAGDPYRAQLATRGGIGPVRWQFVGSLPRSIRLNRTTGLLTGTARKAGTYRITVQAKDSLGVTSKKTFVLVVGT